MGGVEAAAAEAAALLPRAGLALLPLMAVKAEAARRWLAAVMRGLARERVKAPPMA